MNKDNTDIIPMLIFGTITIACIPYACWGGFIVCLILTFIFAMNHSNSHS